MRFINKFFIGLMAITLATTILGFCLDQTILKPQFVTAQLDKSGVYNNLASGLSKQLVSGGDNNADSSGNSDQVQAALERSLTPQFLQTNLDAYITNLLTSVKSGGAIPPLDLTGVIPQIQALGVQLTPADQAQLQKNLTINPSSIGKNQGNNADQSSTPSTTTTNSSNAPNVSKLYSQASRGKWLLVLATLVLAGLVFVTAPHHRLRALGHGFLGATFWLAIYYALFRIAPGIATHQLQTSKDVSISSSVSQLITLAASGVAQHILYAGIGTLAIGIILWVASMFVPHFGGGRSSHGAKGDNRTPLPTVFHKD